jgi:hypothetical protein
MEGRRNGVTILVAAGGGGDALASLLMARRLTGNGSTPIVASYSWDRRLLDPSPGPRRVTDFAGARQLTDRNFEITEGSRLRAGGLSTLCLLAEATTARFVLLDPYGGAQGMRQQILELVNYFSAESVLLVDVGGDLVAVGDEPALRSPLADSLALASLTDVPVSVRVAVAGPGLDGELAPSYVRSRCIALGGELSNRLDPSDVAPYFQALAEHPSESTTLFAAAALGIVGKAEIRDNADLVSLTEASADIYVLSGSSALAGNRLAQVLQATESLAEAEAATLTLCGRSELDYERRKAETLRSRTPPRTPEMRRRLRDYWSSSATRGITLATFRRLGEVMNLTSYDATLIRALAGSHVHERLALCYTALSRA